MGFWQRSSYRIGISSLLVWTCSAVWAQQAATGRNATPAPKPSRSAQEVLDAPVVVNDDRTARFYPISTEEKEQIKAGRPSPRGWGSGSFLQLSPRTAVWRILSSDSTAFAAGCGLGKPCWLVIANDTPGLVTQDEYKQLMHATPAPSATPAPKAAPPSLPASTISGDVQMAADRLWASVLVKCGAKTYALPFYYADGSNRSSRGLMSLTEVDRASFKVKAEKISRNEELNGVQWKGLAIVASPAMRSTGDAGAWGPWREPYDGSRHVSDEAVTVAMVKINGVWRYMTLYGGGIMYERPNWDLDIALSRSQAPSCSDIPGATPQSPAYLKLQPDPAFLQAAELQRQQDERAALQVETLRRGWFTDPDTGLTWAARASRQDLDWNGAVAYCQSLRLAGYSDWRLPGILELDSLHTPLMDVQTQTGYKAGVVGEGLNWSITKTDDPSVAWYYYASAGKKVTRNVSQSQNLKALCVRGQSANVQPATIPASAPQQTKTKGVRKIPQ